MAVVCRLCVVREGLVASEPEQRYASDEELFAHLERDHHMVVTGENETDAEATERFLSLYPDAAACPECKAAGASWAVG